MKEILLSHGQVAFIDDSDYDRVSQIRWRASLQGRQSKKWYACATRSGRYLSMHRFIMDAPEGLHVDHKDGDGLNNVRSNLRLVTPSQNTYNKRPVQNALKGISFHAARGRWQAGVQQNRRFFYLGLYNDPIEAAKAYDAKAKELFGELACLNFPEGPKQP